MDTDMVPAQYYESWMDVYLLWEKGVMKSFYMAFHWKFLHTWSQWQGKGETWTEIPDEDAARWLVRNGHDHVDAAEHIAALEI